MLVLSSLLVIGTGVATLAKGRLGYYNHWGLTVYAPFTIVVGLGFFLLVLLRRKKSH
jgi:hypothetical protein